MTYSRHQHNRNDPKRHVASHDTRASYRPRSSQNRKAYQQRGRSYSQRGRSYSQRGRSYSQPSRSFQLDRRLIIGIVIAIIFIILIVFFATHCSNSQAQTEANGSSVPAESTQEESPEASSEASNETSAEKLTPNRAALEQILGTEETDKLIARAETNDDALWITTHLDEYEFEGPEVEYKILKLAADEEAALEYVREFPEKYPAYQEDTDPSLAMSTDSPSSLVPNTRIPHLYQWDRRWAQTIYCSTTFGLTGCGPTALAMAYQGLTGDNSLDPYDLSLKAQEAGYMLQFDGTTDGFFTQTANEIGLEYEMPAPSVENITSALANGKCIIANFAPGYFTKYGHFVILAGLDDNGNIIMNDPYSVVRSSQTWDPDLIANETRKMFVYSLA